MSIYLLTDEDIEGLKKNELVWGLDLSKKDKAFNEALETIREKFKVEEKPEFHFDKFDNFDKVTKKDK